MAAPAEMLPGSEARRTFISIKLGLVVEQSAMNIHFMLVSHKELTHLKMKVYQTKRAAPTRTMPKTAVHSSSARVTGRMA